MRAAVRPSVPPCVRPAPQSLLRGTIRDSVVARARIPYSFHVKRIRDPRTAARGAGPAPGAPRVGSRKRLGRDWFSGRIKLYTSYIPRECGFEGGIAAELAPARTTHAGRPMAKRHEACVPSPQAPAQTVHSVQGSNAAYAPPKATPQRWVSHALPSREGAPGTRAEQRTTWRQSRQRWAAARRYPTPWPGSGTAGCVAALRR